MVQGALREEAARDDAKDGDGKRREEKAFRDAEGSERQTRAAGGDPWAAQTGQLPPSCWPGDRGQVASVRHGERSVLPGPSGLDMEPPRRLLFCLSGSLIAHFPGGEAKQRNR